MPGKRLRRILFLGCGVVGILLIALPSAGAEPEIEIGLQPSHSVKAGEVSELTIQLFWKTREGDYRFLKPELPLQNLERMEEGASSEVFYREGEEWKRKTFRFKLRSPRPGAAAILPFQIHYVDSITQQGGQLQVESRNLRVVPDRSKLYRGIAGGLIAVATGALVGMFYRRRYLKSRTSSLPPEDSLEDRYLRRLETLTEKFEASRLLRAYLGEKFSLPAPLQTGPEILVRLQSKLSGDERKSLKVIFDKLEDWCYAGSVSSPREWEVLQEKIRNYLQGKKVVGNAKGGWDGHRD